MKAFWLSKMDCRLGYGDGRKARVGVTHKVDCNIELCERGLHASVGVMDAVRYAPGERLWVVELGGEIIKGGDKACATERKYIAQFDATSVLRHFARRQASINIEKIKPYCSDDDYDLIVRWLTTGDESLRSAARSAALPAALPAAWSAARYAARSAAWYAAWYAAESVAEYAAKYAAKYAAEYAAGEMLYEMLPQRIKEAYEGK